MITARRFHWLSGVAITAMILVTGPAIGQNDAPESLLPPGFDQPSPAPSEPPPTRTPSPTPIPDRPQPASPSQPITAPDTTRPDQPGSTSVAGADDEQTDVLEDSLDARLAASAQLPLQSQRSLKSIGVMTPEMGGFAPEALGRTNGAYLSTLMRATSGRLVSRWGTILLRRALVSRLDTPKSVNGADFAAVRASWLLRIGDVDQARRIVQAVDDADFSPQMFDVALQVYLASADPAGMCPALPFLPESKSSAQWQMMEAICASFAGNQSAAGEQIDRAIRQSAADQIDLRLAEKAVGAGVNGRRAVTIEWDGVDRITTWRFGLALATGIEPPIALYQDAPRRYQAWRARAPMLSLASRMTGADLAAAMGVMSSAQMVDLYGAVYDDASAGDDLRARASLLRSAYVQRAVADRLDAMEALWGRSENRFIAYSSHILTAAAAARIPVASEMAGFSDDLIASMVSAGYDRSALRWVDTVETGSLGWALIAVSAPGRDRDVPEGDIDAFVDDDNSEGSIKSKFLIAGLAGLGRISDADRAAFENRLELRLDRQSRWTRAINAAAKRGDNAMVAILAATGMQGNDWSEMTPLHLFHIVSALNASGMNAEARMIAAEAVARS